MHFLDLLLFWSQQLALPIGRLAGESSDDQSPYDKIESPDENRAKLDIDPGGTP